MIYSMQVNSRTTHQNGNGQVVASSNVIKCYSSNKRDFLFLKIKGIFVVSYIPVQIAPQVIYQFNFESDR